jgi:hypothetical protein
MNEIKSQLEVRNVPGLDIRHRALMPMKSCRSREEPNSPL